MAALVDVVAESAAGALFRNVCLQDAGFADLAGQQAQKSLALPQELIAADTQIQAEKHFKRRTVVSI